MNESYRLCVCVFLCKRRRSSPTIIVLVILKNNKYEPIFNYSAQMLMKARLAGAQKGHGLLKKKADALQMRFRQILGKIIEVSSFSATTPRPVFDCEFFTFF